jgi:hypothetical protein
MALYSHFNYVGYFEDVLSDKAVTKTNSFPRTGAMKEGAGSNGYKAFYL